MPLIILGLLVIGGLLAYMYFSDHPENFVGKKPKKKEDSHEEDASSVIYLPNDIEKEKKRRKVKTGK